jgi:S-adenosylmethionine synthetase
VAIEYENNTPIAIANLVTSTHHAPSLSLYDLRYQLIEYVMKPVIPDRLRSHQVMDRERDRLDSTVMFVNPTGAFLVRGLKDNAGLTGRKIIVETYGGMGYHGGGPLSGKDPSIECLNLLRPIYRATAAYGHLGRPEFPWEA